MKPAYTIYDALQELKQILTDYSKKSPNPNWLIIASAEATKISRSFRGQYECSEPADFERLLRMLPAHFTTKYRDCEVPTYCYRYSIPGLNRFAKKLGRLAGVDKEETHGNRSQ